MICLLNTSDYQAGSNSSSTATNIFGGSSDSPDSPPDSPAISIVSSSSSSSNASSSKCPLTESPRPSTPNQITNHLADITTTSVQIDCRQVLHGWKNFKVGTFERYESPQGEVFESSKDVVDHVRSVSGSTDVDVNVVDDYFSRVSNVNVICGTSNVENCDENNIALVVPFTFCDMRPNIVDMMKKKSRKPSREFNKRRRRSVGKIQCRRSTNSSSTSFDYTDDYDDVGSPLTLELQELLSEVVKNVTERLERVDEDDEEHELMNLKFMNEETSDDVIQMENCVKNGTVVMDNGFEEHPELDQENTAHELSKQKTEEIVVNRNKHTAIVDSISYDENISRQEHIFKPNKNRKRRSTVDISPPVSSVSKKFKRRLSADCVLVDTSARSKCFSNEEVNPTSMYGSDQIVESDLEDHSSVGDLPEKKCCKGETSPKEESVFKTKSELEARNRPDSLNLSIKCCPKSKRYKYSRPLTSDHEEESLFPNSADVIDSPEEDVFLPTTQFDDTNDDGERDFEDEIAACNDFEEVDIPLEVQDDPYNQEEFDPLFLSDEDVSPTPEYETSTKKCRIHLVDILADCPLSLFSCCGCRIFYSGSDFLSFHLKRKTMSRTCALCSWYTLRSCNVTFINY